MCLIFVFRTEGQKERKLASVGPFVSNHRMLEYIQHALINCMWLNQCEEIVRYLEEENNL